MTLTATQRARRTNHLGSSDVAAILGVSPWASAYDVWLSKTGKVEEDNSDSEWTNAGDLLEPSVLAWAETQIGKLDRRGTERRADGLPIVVHIDALTATDREPVEAKTSGITGPVYGDWGEAGTDQVPDYYLVQCHAHMLAAGKDICHLPALLGGRGYVLFGIGLDPRLADLIAERATTFWDKHVQGDVPPTDSKPSLEVISRARRQPGKVAKLAPQLVAEFQQAKEQAKHWEQRKKQLQAELLAVDPEAEAFDFNDAAKWFTYFSQSRSTVDAKALQQHHPDVYQQVVSTSTFRVLREVKKPRAKKGE